MLGATRCDTKFRGILWVLRPIVFYVFFARMAQLNYGRYFCAIMVAIEIVTPFHLVARFEPFSFYRLYNITDNMVYIY